MPMSEDSLTVSYHSAAQKEIAETFARQQQIVCRPANEISTNLVLHFGEYVVELKDLLEKSSIHVDFLAGDMAHRKQCGRGQSIAKAIGLKSGIQPPHVLDATAGLARDAYVLANLGCRMTLLEQSPVVAELLKDAISRASLHNDFQHILAQGFELVNDDAVNYMQQLKSSHYPDVIYLDPMFPDRKKSAQVKKNMQMLQKLLAHDDNNEALLNAALITARKRVVVKRPKGAECLGQHKPSMTIDSKKMRYDVYVLAAMKN